MTLISHPHLGEIEYTDEERVFLQAIDRYKVVNHRPHPTWREVLAVIHSLGYRVQEAPVSLPTFYVRGGGKSRRSPPQTGITGDCCRDSVPTK